MYLYGGYDGRQYYGSLYQLNCSNLKWRLLSRSGSSEHSPTKKRGSGMVLFQYSLCLFGGRGDQPTNPAQPGAEFVETAVGVYTNELHLFDLEKGEAVVL